MERILDRAFSKVHGSVTAVQSQANPSKESPNKGPDPASFDRPADGEAETPQQAIQRILHCWKHKEYFKWVEGEEVTGLANSLYTHGADV
jgi:hypothetical protein